MEELKKQLEKELKKRKLEEFVNNDEVSEEKLRFLLDPLSKTQLVDLLAKLGSKYSSIAEEIMNIARGDHVHRKLFVRGLAWNTTSETLCAAFEVHGEIEEGAVIFDKVTGKSRGYGFITYKTMESAQEALGASSKLIDGRLAACNLAREGLSGATVAPDQAQRKLYIGGLSPEITSEMLLGFFSRHGEIEEGSVAYDKDSNRSRCFGFVTYKTVDATKKAFDDTERILGGRNIRVKYADTKIRTAPKSTPPVPVPMAAPPPIANPYPKTGPAQGPSSSFSLRYTYLPSVPSYPPTTNYPSPPVASLPVQYAPPQFSYEQTPIPPKQDPAGMPANMPMSVPNYSYYMAQQ